MSKAGQRARELLCARTHGVLSTHSVAERGYPLGSLTPYVLDDRGVPVILISDIAEHTANLKANSRCSLTIVEESRGEVQAHGRLCILSDGHLLGPERRAGVAERYLRFFPEAEGYFTAHDFQFWGLRPVRLRYIGGFGNIHWIAPEQALVANPFAGRGESTACAHMNADHADAIARYCEFAGIATDGHMPQMVGVDGEALYLRVGSQVERLAFHQSIADMKALRQETIAMCQPDYWQRTRAA